MEPLRTQLRAVANEYARQVAAIIGTGRWYWLGNDGTSTLADFDGEVVLSLDDMQTIIDNMEAMADAPEDADVTSPSSPYRGWLARYGSREAVGKAVREWMDWFVMGRNSERLTVGHLRRDIFPSINLRNWLLGFRDQSDADPIVQTEALCAASSILMKQFGGSAELKDVADGLMKTHNLKQASLQAELPREIDNAATTGSALRKNS